MSYITAIATANPSYKVDQDTIAQFMQHAMQLSDDDARKLRVIFKASGIETRYSVLGDYTRLSDFTFYANSPDFNPPPSTKNRNTFFQQHAPALSHDAAVKALRYSGLAATDITHIITVSCTGMYAPGLDIDLVDSLGLVHHVQRTNINFMGCYAAFNALKAADAFCKNDEHVKVLIICTEICSLHFQRDNTDDNLLANALFADGSAAVIVEAKSEQKRKLFLAAHHSELARHGDKDMAWSIGDVGFEMKLSTYVPDIIRNGIHELTNRLLAKLAICIENIQHFAIHPGGKKILEVIEQELSLNKQQNQWAYHVLRAYGNMSSPTVLFVLKEIFDRLEQKNDKENILSFAFGPGLTLESIVFTYQQHD